MVLSIAECAILLVNIDLRDMPLDTSNTEVAEASSQ
jgi:hypothetical protein